MRVALRAWTLVAVAVALMAAGCKNPPPCDVNAAGQACSDAGEHPYICTGPDVALSNAACQLNPPGCVSGYIDGRIVKQWYAIGIPSTADAKTLLHVTAGYDAGTTVILTAVLSDAGAVPLIDPVVDQGSGVDIVLPSGAAGSKVLLSLADEFWNHVNANVDGLHEFTACATTLEDPDPNGPNPTAITLSNPGDGTLAGSGTGVLSTQGRVDRFTVQVPSGSRQILYLHVTGGCADGGEVSTCYPPPEYRLAYTLKDPQGNPIASGAMHTVYFENDAGLPIDLATAWLAATHSNDGGAVQLDPGTWEVDVQGLSPDTNQGGIPGPGDLRVQYNLYVKVLPDSDLNEPNDDLPSALANNAWTISAPAAAAGAPQISNARGRIAYVQDTDWFVIQLQGPQAQPTLLRYQFQASASAGRFPPLSNTPSREVALFDEVTAGAAACIIDAGLCPQGWDAEPVDKQSTWQSYAASACGGSFGQSLCLADAGLGTSTYVPCGGARSLCLLSDREEDDAAFSSLQNFEGIIKVPAFNGTQRYYLLVQAGTANVSQQAPGAISPWADDTPYTVSVDWYQYPGDGTGSGLWSVDSSYNPAVPSPSLGGINGSLVYGYGRIGNSSVAVQDLFSGMYVRGPFDYDAVPSQIDSYTLTFPGTTSGDQGWELWYEVSTSGGNPVYDLSLELSFAPSPLFFDPNSQNNQWFNGTGSYGAQQNVWDQNAQGGELVTATNNFGCWCIDASAVKPNAAVTMNVLAVNRMSYAPANYQIKTALAPYPYATGYDGGRLCPGLDAGGCQMF